ncbi:GNAT family N-acetyltransferase [Natronorubrum sp. JWXQ-INN-674]|uniref:GNAT family N-acetyltransferase n=1 Tax=Natronorubrum halalkaliphilum TaxID=2691917 RepID=A0A6B0VLR5_9EURY|nr:GNAT family protein [Natronorubrum halalkaliphilum]MXV62514.1 GNAT family N-acetyltransferase [Natronorubrum halalkaliphilum]
MPGARITSGDRVTLRTVESEDRDFLQRAYANPELRYPLGSPLLNQTDLKEWTDDENADRFLVCLEADPLGPEQPDDADSLRPIGLVSVEDADWRRPELVYWLVPAVHGEGYGSEAVSLVVDYVFRTYDTPAVGAAAYDFNDASWGLLESLGFDEEGRIRRDRFVDGEYVDTIQYGLLREHWDLERDRFDS